MTDTRERILWTALELFAENGYEAVSVSDIAGALGITKGALYRHYKNKRDIMDSILLRMEQGDAERAGNHDLPDGPAEQMRDAYQTATLDQIIDFSRDMFRYWTQDGFASRFRRMLTLEQYRSAEMGHLYQQYLASGPVGYVADLFGGLGLPDPKQEAATFYGPMFLLYSIYDGAENKGAVTDMMDAILECACRRLKEETGEE